MGFYTALSCFLLLNNFIKLNRPTTLIANIPFTRVRSQQTNQKLYSVHLIVKTTEITLKTKYTDLKSTDLGYDNTSETCKIRVHGNEIEEYQGSPRFIELKLIFVQFKFTTLLDIIFV